MSIEVFDNREKSRLSVVDPIVRGNSIQVTAYGNIIWITLDTGYRIILPKALVPELVKAAEEQ